MKRLFALLAGIATVLGGCSGANLAGGTGTETTNGGVAMLHNGPAAGAVVRLVDTDNWLAKTGRGESVVLDSTVADANGRFAFASLPAVRYNVQIDHAQGALFFKDGNLPYDTLLLSRHADYRGRLVTQSNPVAAALLGGSAYRATAGMGGVFRFAAMAPGAFAIVAAHDAGNTSGALSFAGARIFEENVEKYGDTLVVDSNTVLIDGFTTGFGMSELGHLIGGIWWYYYSDSLSRGYNPRTQQWEFGGLHPYGGNTSIRPVLNKDGLGNSTLSATVILGDRFVYPVGGVGLSLGKGDNQGFDLSSMTAFAFRARGKGTLRVRLESTVLDSVDDNKHYTSILTLPADWTQIRIATNSLHIDPPDSLLEQSIPWAVAARTIKRIEFEFHFERNSVGDTLLLELDDIALEGMSLSTFHD